MVIKKKILSKQNDHLIIDALIKKKKNIKKIQKKLNYQLFINTNIIKYFYNNKIFLNYKNKGPVFNNIKKNYKLLNINARKIYKY
jgi:hypothetical protein